LVDEVGRDEAWDCDEEGDKDHDASEVHHRDSEGGDNFDEEAQNGGGEEGEEEAKDVTDVEEEPIE
jgi:hypothetical protein